MDEYLHSVVPIDAALQQRPRAGHKQEEIDCELCPVAQSNPKVSDTAVVEYYGCLRTPHHLKIEPQRRPHSALCGEGNFRGFRLSQHTSECNGQSKVREPT